MALLAMGKAGPLFERRDDRYDALERKLREALTVRVRRRVRRDTTLPLEGTDWELDQGFLAGRLVMVARCLVDMNEAPWVEHALDRKPLRPRGADVDPTAARGNP